MPGGRPTLYSDNLSDKICSLLSEGQSLRAVCREEGMPCAATVFSWLRTIPEFLEQYEKAKQESADAMVDEILDIADNANNDWMEISGDSEGYKQNGEAIQRSRLRVDTRKWIASKLKPKKYGDKLETVHSGSIGLKDLSDAQLDARLGSIIEPESED